ncbi:uncharacterized protein LY89DRAFT_701095 [Mollisia scopiformis]|uniref:Zn(2)-C6 fungal-type domain-containing protein n=1 Tax=Mollisia scopiformis TaxID=149040 RepID=A0A132BDU7_MOLSC|nr:uncharacterized protein LY89DRAFT_701095 [Mollisia scopiformis]KUJ10169.1 hypothetical protein LY89DRAFT_701095 [Mollisia scopiformis]
MAYQSSAQRLHALRDEYGDPKPAEISRKVTACVSCRKHKVKCDLQNSGVPCTRCRKRGLSCAVKKSLQMLLEDDATWKGRIEEEVARLTAGMARLSEHLSLPDLLEDSEDVDSARGTTAIPTPAAGQPISSSIEEVTGDNSDVWNDNAVEDYGPAAIPASIVSEVTKHSPSARVTERSRSKPDIISRGILTLEQAEMLFNYYMTKHDNSIYSVLEEGSTFTTIRSSSPFLLAAICAVASLHVVSSDVPYERCYDEFVQMSTQHAFSSRNNMDDIRALCIGAFWLPEISWILISNAVRIATELQLHRAYRGAIAGNRKAYVAARLYYLVHVCDHQFSIAYGRPPLTGEYEAALTADEFLTSKFIVEDDFRLISQVKHWSITSNVFQTFGTDIQHPIPENLIGHLQRLNLELDTCRLEWSTKFRQHKHIGNYPRKGVSLHYHFAKLYLCSHAFRGISNNNAATNAMSREMREVADNAVLSATSILRSINTDVEFQSFMSDLPLYFDTMIAFASVFLFRITTSYIHAIHVDVHEILRLLGQSVRVLDDIASKIRPAHLLAGISEGLKSLLEQFENARQREAPNTERAQPPTAGIDMQLPEAIDLPVDQFD